MPGNSAVGIQRRHCSFPVIWNPDAASTYLHFIEWHQAKPRTCPLCEAVSLASESCQFVESRQPYLGVLIIFKIFARKCEWWCQPILRVRPCRHRQHSLIRNARVRCAAHYGTITRYKSYSFGTDEWSVPRLMVASSFQVIGPNAPMEPTAEWCPDFHR